MTFLNPTYFWGLLALLLPIMIHLLNKGEIKVMKVGSIKHFKSEDTKQSRKFKLNELLLLLLRLLTIGLLVFILAEPQLKIKIENTPITYLVEPSLLENLRMDSYLDSVPANSTRFFSEGFPVLDKNSVPKGIPNYWQLAQQLDYLETDSVIVFTKAKLSGFKGMRTSAANNIKWVVLEDDTTIKKFVGAELQGDTIDLVKVHSSNELTDIAHEFYAMDRPEIRIVDSDSLELEYGNKSIKLPIWSKDTLQIEICYEEEFETELHYLSAALAAVSEYSGYGLQINTTKENDFKTKGLDLLLWLKNEPVPQITTPLLRCEPDSLSTQLIKMGAKKNTYYLTERLTIENVLKDGLSERLLEILITNPKLQNALTMNDTRSLAEKEVLPETFDVEMSVKPTKLLSLSKWLWFFVIFMLVVERLIAKIRKQ